MPWLLPPLTPHFHAAIRDVHARAPEMRVHAAERLARPDEEAQLEPARQGLETLSTDVHPGVRAAAVAGLGDLALERSLPVVEARLDDPSPQVRELAVVALGRIGGERARAHLTHAVTNEAAEVRFQALAALADRFPDDAVPLALSAIDDPDDKVRAQVADVLGQLCTDHTVGHLGRLLQDAAPEVRLEAALGLAAFGDRRGQSVLIEAVQARVRLHETALALGEVAGPEGIEALADLAGRSLAPAAVRAAAAAGLCLTGDPRGEAGLRRLLTGFRRAPRTYAVMLTGQTRARGLLPELLRLCDAPRGCDPLALAEALIALADTGADVRPGLISLSQRGDQAGEVARRWLRLPESVAIPE